MVDKLRKKEESAEERIKELERKLLDNVYSNVFFFKLVDRMKYDCCVPGPGHHQPQGEKIGRHG